MLSQLPPQSLPLVRHQSLPDSSDPTTAMTTIEQRGSQVVAQIDTMSDQRLSEQFLFQEEVGLVNWGSVWSAHTRASPAAVVRNPTSSLSIFKNNLSMPFDWIDGDQVGSQI